MAAGETLATLLYRGAAIEPSATAIESDTDRISFARLLDRVESIAADLCQRYPEPGTRIGLCAGNHAEHVCTYLAILISGNVWVPLNPANGSVLNTVISARAKPACVIVDESSTGAAPENSRLVAIGSLGEASAAFDPVTRAPGDVAAIKFTGGTSGEPKGVLQTHANMLAVIDNLLEFYAFNERDCNLAIAPLTHGSSHFVLPVLAAGGRLRFVSEPSAGVVLEALRSGTTLAFMPPTLIYKLLREPGLSPGQFASLRHLTYSAAPMPAARIVEAQAAFGPSLSALYGQTEAPMTITALGTDEMRDPGLMETAGKACGSSEVRVVDDDGIRQANGQVGHVEVHGPIVMPAYLDDAELTAKRIRGGWLRTGDLGRMDDAGYLTLTGRAGDLIISGGFNVYPAEVENVLAQAPGVAECCVFGTEDPYWGERIDAVVTMQPGSASSASEIDSFARERLGSVRSPKNIYVAGSIPRNAVGKVVRRDMPGFITTLESGKNSDG